MAEGPRCKRRKQANPRRNGVTNLSNAESGSDSDDEDRLHIVEEDALPSMPHSPGGTNCTNGLVIVKQECCSEEDDKEREELIQRGDTPSNDENGTPDSFSQLLTCPYCSRGYKRHASLKEHVKLRHEKNDDNYSCTQCSYTFSQKVQLERHMSAHKHGRDQRVLSQSGGSRKFKCSECTKAFKYKHHLKEHLRIHSGEKPYECSNCKKRFSHSGSYSSHISSKKCVPPPVTPANSLQRPIGAAKTNQTTPPKSIAPPPTRLLLREKIEAGPTQEQRPIKQLKTEPAEVESKPVVMVTGGSTPTLAPPTQGVVQALVLPTMGLVQPISINLSDLQSALKVASERGGTAVVRQVLAASVGANGAKVVGQASAGPVSRTQTLLLQNPQNPQLLSAISLPVLEHDSTTKIIINYGNAANAKTPATTVAHTATGLTGTARTGSSRHGLGPTLGQTATSQASTGQAPTKPNPTPVSASAPTAPQSGPVKPSPAPALLPVPVSAPVTAAVVPVSHPGANRTQPQLSLSSSAVPLQIRPSQPGLVQLSLIQTGQGQTPVVRPAIAQLATTPTGPTKLLLAQTTATGSGPSLVRIIQAPGPIGPLQSAAEPKLPEPEAQGNNSNQNTSKPQNPPLVVRVKVEPGDPEEGGQVDGQKPMEEEEEQEEDEESPTQCPLCDDGSPDPLQALLSCLRDDNPEAALVGSEGSGGSSLRSLLSLLRAFSAASSPSEEQLSAASKDARLPITVVRRWFTRMRSAGQDTHSSTTAHTHTTEAHTFTTNTHTTHTSGTDATHKHPGTPAAPTSTCTADPKQAISLASPSQDPPPCSEPQDCPPTLSSSPGLRAASGPLPSPPPSPSSSPTPLDLSASGLLIVKTELDSEGESQAEPLDLSLPRSMQLHANDSNAKTNVNASMQQEPLNLSCIKKEEEPATQQLLTSNHANNHNKNANIATTVAMAATSAAAAAPVPQTTTTIYLTPQTVAPLNIALATRLVAIAEPGSVPCLPTGVVTTTANQTRTILIPQLTYTYTPSNTQNTVILNGCQEERADSASGVSVEEEPNDTDPTPSPKKRRIQAGQYACDLCDKIFQKSSSLLRHKYEHTGKRPHECAVCRKAFKHKHHLIEHSRLHSGEKPYQCDKCGKRFSHSGSYSQHMNHRYSYCHKDASTQPFTLTHTAAEGQGSEEEEDEEEEEEDDEEEEEEEGEAISLDDIRVVRVGEEYGSEGWGEEESGGEMEVEEGGEEEERGDGVVMEMEGEGVAEGGIEGEEVGGAGVEEEVLEITLGGEEEEETGGASAETMETGEEPDSEKEKKET